uniref:Complex 1 LYR protein domain-containing protein n=1 Tax=Leptocylindrus danicus TaxID=163516 RepID=A0A7S2K2A3_9STRA|mmetsp:Transcript_16376/g.24149  ORF Transcript_16376/g.24149 Transcript_16376/m.24149 type:complete len:153 (+) Transcript_16376:209-667(+)
MSSRQAASVVSSRLGTRAARQRQRRQLDESNIPSLKEFMHRSRVIKQYRSYLRAIRCIPEDDAWREQVAREIRDSFRLKATETDKLSVTMAVTDGDRKLVQLQSMVGYQQKNDVNDSGDNDSWLNIVDEGDQRGRVGMQWPWETDGSSKDNS